MKIKVGLALPDMPSTIHECALVAAPKRPFMSRGPMMRQSDLALVMATAALACASSSCTICSFSDSSRKDFLRPPVRNPTLVWARRTVWAVIPAQVVTPMETMESLEEDTQLLARNKLVMSLRLCSTARLDLASG